MPKTKYGVHESEPERSPEPGSRCRTENKQLEIGVTAISTAFGMHLSVENDDIYVPHDFVIFLTLSSQQRSRI